MTPETIRLVQDSWAKVVPIKTQAAALFYNNLFEADPSLRPMFKANIDEQGNKLMQMLNGAVNGLSDLGALVPVLENLARRHVGYGVKDAHYDTVGAALLKTLEQGLGEAFTAPVKAAWTELYQTVAGVMIKASATA